MGSKQKEIQKKVQKQGQNQVICQTKAIQKSECKNTVQCQNREIKQQKTENWNKKLRNTNTKGEKRDRLQQGRGKKMQKQEH